MSPGRRTISLVIPAHNEERTLPQVLEALAKQNRDDLEVEAVVVNDASTDQTHAVAAAHAARHPWIRVLDNPQNLGLSATLARGIRETRGNIVVTLHADIVPRGPDWLQTLTTALADPRVAAAGSTVHARIDGLSFVDRFFLESPPLPMLGNKADAYRRRVFEELGGFDTTFRVAGEDVDLSMRIQRAGYEVRFPAGADVDHVMGSHQVGLRKHLAKEIQYAENEPRLWRRYGYTTNGLYGASLLLVAINLALLPVQERFAMPLWITNGTLLGLALALDFRWKRKFSGPAILAYFGLGLGVARVLAVPILASPATVFLCGVAASTLAWDLARGLAKAIRLRDPRMLLVAVPFFSLQDLFRSLGFLKGLGGFLRP